MCGHNLCNLQSALPRCAPRVLSISAGRGGARLAFCGAGQPVFPQGGAGWGGASIPGRKHFESLIDLSVAILCKKHFNVQENHSQYLRSAETHRHVSSNALSDVQMFCYHVVHSQSIVCQHLTLSVVSGHILWCGTHCHRLQP